MLFYSYCSPPKWSSLTWHLANSARAFVTNQLIWISLNQGANSTWWGRTRKVWGRTRHKVGANSIGGERGAIRWGRTRKVWGRTRYKVGANSIGGESGGYHNWYRSLFKNCFFLKYQLTYQWYSVPAFALRHSSKLTWIKTWKKTRYQDAFYWKRS